MIDLLRAALLTKKPVLVHGPELDVGATLARLRDEAGSKASIDLSADEVTGADGLLSAYALRRAIADHWSRQTVLPITGESFGEVLRVVLSEASARQLHLDPVDWRQFGPEHQIVLLSRQRFVPREIAEIFPLRIAASRLMETRGRAAHAH